MRKWTAEQVNSQELADRLNARDYPDEDDVALARRFLDLPDEDFTFIDPEDIKRLARAVLAKVD